MNICIENNMKLNLFRTHLFVFLILSVFCSILYSGSLSNEFHFDDYVYILNNKQIKNIKISLNSLWERPLHPDRSLVQLSFAANYAVHGYNYKGYQIVNIFIHAINGFILYLTLFLLIGKDEKNSEKKIIFVSIVTAILFISHPLAVNSVAYISQRHGLMATTFYISSFYYYAKWINKDEFKNKSYLFASFLCLIFSIHCKEMAITLPIVLLCYSFVYHKQIIFKKKIVFIFISSMLLLIYLFLYKFFFERKDYANVAVAMPEKFIDLYIILMNGFQIIFEYIKIILFPMPAILCADRNFRRQENINFEFVSIFLFNVSIILTVFIFLSKKNRLPAFGMLWFYITLFPYLFVSSQDVLVDYKTYLPCIGLMTIFSSVFNFLTKKYKKTMIIFLVLIALFYCWSTLTRIKIFSTEINFWTDVINKDQGRARPLNNRGLAWKRNGEHEKAICDFKKAIEIDKFYYPAYANTGDVYLEMGNIEEAVWHYLEYANFLSNKADAYFRIGNGYMLAKKYGEGIKWFRNALKFNKINPVIWYNLGLSYGYLKKWGEAERSFRKAIRLQPDYYQAYGSLGAVYFLTGRDAQAESFYQQALEINPQYEDAIYNLAVYYVNMNDKNRMHETIKALQQVAPEKAAILLKFVKQAPSF